MSFQVSGEQGPSQFEEVFFLIPQLAFEVYLGEGFLRSSKVICLSPGGVYTSPCGTLGRSCLDRWLSSFKEIQKNPIRILWQPSKANNVRGAHPDTENLIVTPNDIRSDEKKVESNGSLESDQSCTPISSTVPPLEIAGSEMEKNTPRSENFNLSKGGFQSIDEEGTANKPPENEGYPPTRNPHNSIPPLHSVSKHDFDKMVAPYYIDEEERGLMWSQYLKEGRAQIPVTNYVEKFTETNGLSEVSENYYEDLEGLLEVLEIENLPQGPLNIMKNFLVKNMDVFSRSETDVGYYSGYEAKVSLRRDVKDINVKFNPFPAAVRPKVRSILRKYHDLGIISFAEECIKDPIVSNLVVVKKANNQIRIAFDARCINYLAAKGKCYHRSLAQTLRDIDLNSRFFSTLDQSSAYFCIPLHQESRRYFCFRDADNKLCF